MIPIKILCGCGQKYAFDVEPVGGSVGQAVLCPVCASDGTTVANEIIAQHLATQLAAPSELRLREHYSPPPIPRPPPANPVAAPRTGSSGAVNGKRVVSAALAGIVLLLAAAAAVWFGRGYLQKRGAAAPVPLANDGLPHTLNQLNAWYVEPPSGQNAAPFYCQGFDALQIDHGANLPLLGKGKLPPPAGTIPPPMKLAMAAFVQANRDALQFFDQGATYEHCRYPVDLSQGFDLLLPHLVKFRAALQSMELSAILHADEHEGKQAGRDLLIALALERSLDAEPSMLSQFIRASSIPIVAGTWEQIVNRTALPRESLNELFNAFQKIEAYDARGDGFNRAIASERVMSLAILERPEKLQQRLVAREPGLRVPEEQRKQLIAYLEKAPDLKEERRYYEETFQQLMAARTTAFPERLKNGELVGQHLKTAAERKLVLAEWLLPGFTAPAAREANGLAHARLGLIAVALEQFRGAHENRYPSALSELTPDFLPSTPPDPFDGQPLRYRKKGVGYVLYSIGADLKDDAGQRTNGKEGDIVFSVIRPPVERLAR